MSQASPVTETVERIDLSNVSKLRDFMLQQIQRAAEGDLTPAAINSMANMCGKVIATVKLEHDHSKISGNQPMIGFVDKANPPLQIDQQTGEVK